jgi:hypothetical protein
MPSAKVRASTILGALEEAQTELGRQSRDPHKRQGRDGGAVWLAELHGLLISISGHDGKWPVSTVKFAQS